MNDFQAEMEQAAMSVLGLASKLEPLTERLSRMVDMPINRESIQAMFKVLNLPAGLQSDVFMGIEEDSLWGLYNAFTSVLTKANTHRAEGINRQVGRFLMGGR